MKLITKTIAAIVLCVASSCVSQPAEQIVDTTPGYTLSDDMTEVKVGEDGSLLALRNRETGHNYAGIVLYPESGNDRNVYFCDIALGGGGCDCGKQCILFCGNDGIGGSGS